MNVDDFAAWQAEAWARLMAETPRERVAREWAEGHRRRAGDVPETPLERADRHHRAEIAMGRLRAP